MHLTTGNSVLFCSLGGRGGDGGKREGKEEDGEGGVRSLEERGTKLSKSACAPCLYSPTIFMHPLQGYRCGSQQNQDVCSPESDATKGSAQDHNLRRG